MQTACESGHMNIFHKCIYNVRASRYYMTVLRLLNLITSFFGGFGVRVLGGIML